jgi:hypothetical protein
MITALIISNMNVKISLMLFCLLLQSKSDSSSDPNATPSAPASSPADAKAKDDGITQTVSGDESPYVCNEKVVLQLFGDTDKLKASNAINHKAIKRICPKLENSCCTREQVSGFLKQYKLGVKDMQRVKRLHEFVITNFSMNTQTSIKTLFNSYKTQKIKQCMGEENFRKIDADLDYIFEHLEQANIYFLFSYNFILRFYSGVACELCNADSHAYIDARNDSHPVAQIGIANKNITEIILISQLFAEYLKFMRRFINLLKMVECKQGADDIKFLDEIDPLIRKFIQKSEIFETCRLKYKDIRFFDKEDKCNEIFEIFKSLLQARVISEVAEIYRRIYMSLANSFQIKYYNDKGLDGVESTIHPTFLSESNEYEYFYFGSVDYHIAEEGGLDIFENHFASNLIKEGAMIAAVKVMVALLALVMFWE